MVRGSRPEKVEEWRTRLDRYKSSGQSVERFCENEGVSAGSFYQWKKKLNDSTARPRAAGFQRVQIHDKTNSMSSVRETIVRLSEGIEIVLGSDPAVVTTVMQQLLASRQTKPAGGESC